MTEAMQAHIAASQASVWVGGVLRRRSAFCDVTRGVMGASG